MRWMRHYLLLFLFTASAAGGQTLAPAPPMGWNSWDSYGATIDEAHFRSSAKWVADTLKPYGYKYVVIDAEWFDADPPAEGSKKDAKRSLDAFGRYLPDPIRFPSSADGAGFAPLAAYVHSLGLKFGIHVLQGIPKEAVGRDAVIQGTEFHAKDAANTAAGCQWNPDNYDLQTSAAGQAYYDSIVRMYAAWGVDLIKIDCIASRPYKGDEVRMFHEAIAHAGRPIVLSLSPGEAPLDEASNLQRYAQLWRISDDTWDLWHSDKPYPQGVNDQFPRAAKWVASGGPGHWPDADMLPVGHLGPAPGWGKPRESRLSHDEQRSLMNLWCIARSPLMYGGDPQSTDSWTLSLLTDRALLAVDQSSRDTANPILTDALAVWTAVAAKTGERFVGVFNRQDIEQTVKLTWGQIGVPAGQYLAKDLWTGIETVAAPDLRVTLPAHGSAMLVVRSGKK